MQRIIIDTNIVVSSILGKSYPHEIVYNLILKGRVNNCISEEILSEFKSTLNHPKFDKFSYFRTEAIELLSELEIISELRDPTFKLNLLSDPDDIKFLELALSTQADFLITGNSRHFPMGKFENTEIISPEKYWNTYWK